MSRQKADTNEAEAVRFFTSVYMDAGETSKPLV